MILNVKDMSKKQLEKLLKDVQAALSKIEEKEKKEALKAAEQTVAKFGFSLAELTGAPPAPKRAKKAAPKTQGAPKYANPANEKETWTGKGRKPKWYVAALEAGATAESLEI
jgi:DNA-binding protein H-NS